MGSGANRPSALIKGPFYSIYQSVGLHQNSFPLLKELCQKIESWSNQQEHGLACYLRRVWTAKHEELLAQLKQDANAWQKWIDKVCDSESQRKDKMWQKDKVYGWQQFWNVFNEVRGYVLLKSRGFFSPICEICEICG
jgi:hypothetical protein